MDGWLSTSFVVMFLLAGSDLLYRFLIQEGYEPTELVLYVLLIAAVVGLGYALLVPRKTRLRVPKRPTHTLVFLMLGAIFFFSFILLRHAQIRSPNIGYVNAIVYSSVLITILGTALLFRDRLQWQGVLGAVLILGGLGLIASLGQSR